MTNPTTTTLRPEQYTAILKAETYRRFACTATTPKELRDWQASFRPALRKALGLDIMAEREPASPQTRLISETQRPDHVREEWTIQTEPGFQLPFYLLRPLRQSRALPLVLTPHGHGIGAKATYVGLTPTGEEAGEQVPGERDIARQAVREGYIAIAPDMRGFASLRRQVEIEKGAGSSCAELQKYALLFGRTLIGERVWDIGKLIDYATTREEIDTSRILITGNSGGGTVSLFAAACDLRITVCVPGSYFCTFADSIGAMHHCPCNFVPGILRMGELHDVAGLIAPRPFLAVNGVEDKIFPIEATRSAYAELRRIYRAANAEEQCELYEGNEGHRYYKSPVWPFARKYLGEGVPTRAVHS